MACALCVPLDWLLYLSFKIPKKFTDKAILILNNIREDESDGDLISESKDEYIPPQAQENVSSDDDEPSSLSEGIFRK